MTNVRTITIAALALLLSLGGTPLWAQGEEKDPQITLRVGKNVWTYTHDELLAMATTKIPNQKRTRQKPAIPLETLLFKDTGLKLTEVEIVYVIPREGMITILRGKDLAYIDKLVLATGLDKGKKKHPWAMAAEDEKTYKKLAPTMGSSRKHDINRIDIVLKPGAGE